MSKAMNRSHRIAALGVVIILGALLAATPASADGCDAKCEKQRAALIDAKQKAQADKALVCEIFNDISELCA